MTRPPMPDHEPQPVEPLASIDPDFEARLRKALLVTPPQALADRVYQATCDRLPDSAAAAPVRVWSRRLAVMAAMLLLAVTVFWVVQMARTTLVAPIDTPIAAQVLSLDELDVVLQYLAGEQQDAPLYAVRSSGLTVEMQTLWLTDDGRLEDISILLEESLWSLDDSVADFALNGAG